MKLSSVVLALSATLLLAACESSEQKAERHFASAQELLAAGDVDRAIVEFRNVFANDDGHKEARLLFARVQLDKGRVRAAISNYLRVAEQFPEEYEAVVKLAELAAFLQSWDEAERHGRAAVELNPDHIDTRAVAAALDYRQALLDRDDVARAAVLERAESILGEKPESIIVRNILADGYNWQGDFEAALAQVEASLELAPDHKPLHFSKLGILGQIGDEPAIAAHLRDMATRFPDDDEIKASMIRFLIASGDLEEAESFFRSVADPASGEIGPYIAFIRFVSETKGVEAAIAEIESVLETTSQPLLLRSIRAGMLFDEGQRADAITEMEAILAEEGDTVLGEDLEVTLAQMLLVTGNEVGARRRVEEVLSRNPVNIEALKLQAGWLIEGDLAEDAISILRTGLTEAPGDVDALTLLSRAYDRVGNKELARDTLAQAVAASGSAPGPSLRYARVLFGDERYRPAEQVLVSALRVEPENVDILALLGEVYLTTREFGRADGVRERLERLGTPAALEREARLRVALLAGQERTNELLATLEDMASAEGGNVEATIALIRTRLTNGEPDVALNIAETALGEDPGNTALRLALAATRAAVGDDEGARNEYEAMIAEGVADAQTWRIYIVTLLREGRAGDAVAALQQATEAFPSDPDLLWMRASYLESEGDIDGAIAVYEELYDINSNSLVIANNLASLLATWRPDDAEAVDRAFRVARRLNGTEVPAFQDTYGWLLHLTGKSEEAIEYLEPAAEALSADPIVQYHLGTAYLAVGRTEEAAARLRIAIEIAGDGADYPQLEVARSQLAEIETAVAPEATDDN